MLTAIRKSRLSHLAKAKLWLAGLGLWSGGVGLVDSAYAQDAYPPRLTTGQHQEDAGHDQEEQRTSGRHRTEK